jgi:hypothetical protein
MTLVIVPNVLRDRINAVIDDALRACPDAEGEREDFYSELLAHFNEHGTVPESITILPREVTPC